MGDSSKNIIERKFYPEIYFSVSTDEKMLFFSLHSSPTLYPRGITFFVIKNPDTERQPVKAIFLQQEGMVLRSAF